MRAAALPRFRKLYGRIEKDIPAGTQLKVDILVSRRRGEWQCRLLRIEYNGEVVGNHDDELAWRKEPLPGLGLHCGGHRVHHLRNCVHCEAADVSEVSLAGFLLWIERWVIFVT